MKDFILDPCSEDYEDQFGEEIENDAGSSPSHHNVDQEQQENELFDQIIGALEDVLVGTYACVRQLDRLLFWRQKRN